MGLFTTTASAASKTVPFGPSSWTQYRRNADNNPVYNNGQDKPATKMRVFKTDNQIRSTPVVVGNNLYVGNHHSGKLYSFNIKTGKLNWKNQAKNWVHSAMMYYKGQIFVGYGDRNFPHPGLRGTGKSGVLSLNAKTGKILWDFSTKGEVMPTPVVYKGNVYAVTGGKKLYELNPKTGQDEWTLNLGSYVSMSSPSITNGIMYFGGADPFTFFAVNLNTKKILWKRSFPQVGWGLDDVPPVISNHLVITTALEKNKQGSIDHYVYAMNAKTGKMVWQTDLGSGKLVPNNKSGAPMIYKGKIFVGSPVTQTFYGLNLKTGKKLWSFHSGVMKAPPVAYQGIVYFTTKAGDVYALKTANGNLLGKKHLGGALAPAGPIIINNYLIVGSQDHNVYMVPTKQISGVKPKPAPKTADPGSAQAQPGHPLLWWIGIPAIVLVLLVLVIFGFFRRRQS